MAENFELCERRMGIVYDGTNSAQLDSLITNFDIISEADGVLTFESASSMFIAHAGEHIIHYQGMVFAVFTTADYQNFYTQVATYP